MAITRSRPQVIFNHLPGSLLYSDEKNVLGLVTNVYGNLDSSIDLNRLTNRINVEIRHWREGETDEAGNVNPDISYLQPSDIEVIRPENVEWKIFPFYFQCRQCGIWQYQRDFLKNQGHCHYCKSEMEQTRFVWAHHCGYLTPLAPGKRAHCPRHKERFLYLHDTGTFTTSSWLCKECGYQAPVGFLQCPQCTSTVPRPQPMLWNDPGVYSVFSFQMVNFNQEDWQRLHTAVKRDIALRSVLSGEIEPGSGAVLNLAEMSDAICKKCGAQQKFSAKYCDQCGSEIFHEKAKTVLNDSSFSSEIIDDLVTFSLLWDLSGTSSLKFKGQKSLADRFGLSDLIYLERFPISLVGLGFRRQRSKRPATLNLFEAKSETKMIQVYTNSTEVEACGIRLNARSVLNWLHNNDFLKEDSNFKTDSPINAFNKLQSLISTYTLIEQVVSGLLHTISHAYIFGLSWCSGMDLSSFSEVILLGVQTAIVHAGDTSLGGLSSIFSQTPWQPLELASTDLVTCQLDPSCHEDDGGACVACIHLPLGCAMWNSTLSRAYLFGGKTKEGHVIKKGFWQG